MALEPVDVTTYSAEIEDAYLKVVKGADPETRWLILSPAEKKQYAPQYTGSKFSDFLAGFDDDKVQYGMARVSPPGSDVEKLLLVGWCPDSAPLKTRASFASNFGTIANQVLRGYHVQVTARDEDDLSERELLLKISNAAGARYSIQQKEVDRDPLPTKTTSAPKPQPAAFPKPGTAAKNVEMEKKVEPTKPSTAFSSVPVQKVDKDEDNDWHEPEIRERDFNEEPLKPNKSTWKPIGKVDLQAVISEEKAKPDPRLVSSVSLESSKKINASDDIANLKTESKQKRESEYNQILGTKSSMKTEQLEASSKGTTSPQKEVDNSDPVSVDNQESVSNLRGKLESISVDNEPVIIKPNKYTSSTVSEPVAAAPRGYKKVGRPLPGLHQNIDEQEKEEEEDGDDKKQEEESQPPAPPLAPRPVPQIPQSVESVEESESDEETEEEASEPVRASSQQPPPPPVRRVAEQVREPSAIAEYDYEAGEDNELTFKEGDRIIDIEFVDDDWWLGVLKNTGEKGLFPSNYVKLQQ
ncbi:Abp1p Ecym_2526 [Eremothecium cymbalariae DBVPG|uniref:Actin-binding protein n=1 Tax=Eremothecium cymbalariae (strain CBS 270.75 / DBVPG 7215 / KCTC 17166 / NRRL Y-17582) TaxID=931890 RepID=G8JQ89_ERECY|nr:Hypothetical protein Ecym_2526 [Eremothecium cymbalariae DBVPG\